MKAIFVFWALISLSGDRIYLTDGKEYLGKLLKIGDDSVFFAVGDSTMSFPLEDVASIDFKKKREGDEWKSAGDITDSLLLWALSGDLSDFQGAGYVNLHRLRRIVIGRDTSIVFKLRRIVRITGERGKDFANRSFLFFPEREKVSLDFARAVLPDSRVVSIRDNAIEDVSVISRPALYDKARRRKFAIPGAEIGSILDYSYTIRRERVTPDRPLYFDLSLGDREPFIRDVVEVEIPAGFRILHREEGLEGPDSTLRGNSILYRWIVTDHRGFSREPLMPPPAYLLPRLTVGMPDSFEGIMRRYRNLVADSSDVPSEFIDRFKGIADRDSLLIDVYTWVARNIKTVPLTADRFSIVPFSPEAVLENSFGTPLDKSFLLYCVLKKLGYHADFVLVPDRSRGGLIEEVPSLSQFKTALVLLGDSLYLYPAEADADMGYVDPRFQGVKGLSLRGELVRIPFLGGRKAEDSFYLKVRFDSDGGAKVELREEAKGRQALELRGLRVLSPEERKKRVEERIGKLFPSSELQNFRLLNLDDLSEPVVLEAEFSLGDFYRELGDYIFFRLPGLNYSAKEVALEKRRFPIYVEEGGSVSHRYEIEIPEGYEVKYFPKSANYGSPLQRYSVVVRAKGGKIFFEDSAERLPGLFDRSSYRDFKYVVGKMSDASKSWIVLRRTDNLKYKGR